jgi:hypothetical protein
MSEAKNICISKGEILKCFNGHDCAEALKDIHFGDVNNYFDFKPLGKTEIKQHYPMICGECGAPYAISSNGAESASKVTEDFRSRYKTENAN